MNDWITENHKVTITEEAIDDAKARGAQAMFGEKYGDVVRVVDIPNISIELCGGNHVVSTADLQQFKIVAESAVAAGTRRIEALVGEQRVGQYNDNQQQRAFADYEKRYAKVLQKAKTLGHDVPDQLPTTATLQTIDAAIATLTQLGKQLDGLLKQQQQGQASDLFTTIVEASLPLQNGAGKAIFKRLDEQPIPVLRDLADRLVDKLGDSAVVLVSETNGKGHAIAKVSPTVLSKLTAKDLINDLTSITGGGGGRDNMAQAGGIGADQIDAGIAHITKNMHKRLLGIDYGDVRIGVAVSDPLGLTAQPVGTIKNSPQPWTKSLPLLLKRRLVSALLVYLRINMARIQKSSKCA